MGGEGLKDSFGALHGGVHGGLPKVIYFCVVCMRSLTGHQKGYLQIVQSHKRVMAENKNHLGILG
jgi:hypothetical protein